APGSFEDTGAGEPVGQAGKRRAVVRFLGRTTRSDGLGEETAAQAGAGQRPPAAGRIRWNRSCGRASVRFFSQLAFGDQSADLLDHRVFSRPVCIETFSCVPKTSLCL